MRSCTGIDRSLAMAEMVGSAAAEEILKQVFAGLIGKQQQILLATQVVKMILKIDDVISPSEYWWRKPEKEGELRLVTI